MRLKPLALLLAAPLGGQQPQPSDKAMRDLLELMRTPVVSASKSSEPLSDAPATVIVLQRADLEARGYTELDQILDDLPGMDVARSRGANYFKSYWRGYRNDIGDPFLVLVDGVGFNHLWYDTADTALVTYPISAVERVEVVYGPASALYGANAFMGVINIITRRPSADGTEVHGRFTGGSFSTRIADLEASHREGDFSFTLAARSDEGDLDPKAAERYEYTKAAYYSNSQLWGSVVNDSGLAGSASSEHQHQALDARFRWKDFELGVQRLVISSGFGTAYAADESQSIGLWARPETSVYLRHPMEFGERLSSTAMVRYRRSDLDPDSFDVESYYGYGAGNSTVITHYEVLDSSLAYTQDFQFRATPALSLDGGFSLEQKDLQKAYLTSTDPAVQADGTLSDANHFNVLDRAAYAQGRWRLAPGQQLTLGLRNDNDSIYGSADTLRGGYVGSFGAFGVKALYGQAYQEPTPRLLYGATSGTGSNTALRPERSNTAQVGLSWTRPSLGFSLDLYRVLNSGRIQKEGATVVNSGDQEVRGADLGFQALLPVESLRQWKVWATWSHYFQADDLTPTPTGTLRTRSGDLAENKLLFGTTLSLDSHFDATLLGRGIGHRITVLSNPVREVPGYATFDLSLNLHGLAWKGLGASLRVANLTDKAYFEPGLRDAGAGITPGYFDPGGTWIGSKSYYNSLLPQPGREVQLTVTVDF